MVEDHKSIRDIAKDRANERRAKDKYFRWFFAEMFNAFAEHLAYRKPLPPITDPGVVSPWEPSMQQQFTRRAEWADMQTVLQPITDPRNNKVQPITGDIDMSKVTQADKQTTGSKSARSAIQELEEMVLKSLIARAQQKIIQYYYAHGETMPLTIEMSRSDKLTLNPHLSEGCYFPDTHVRVVGINGFQDIVCKPETLPTQEALTIEDTTSQDQGTGAA